MRHGRLAYLYVPSVFRKSRGRQVSVIIELLILLQIPRDLEPGLEPGRPDYPALTRAEAMGKESYGAIKPAS